MSTPKGTRCWKINLADHDCLHVYSNEREITLQMRRTVATETDLLSLSFKVAVQLDANQALQLAAELLSAAQVQITRAKKAGIGCLRNAVS